MSTKRLIRLILIMLALILFMITHNTAWATDEACDFKPRDIVHKGFDYNDPRQDMVWYAYKLWWIEFVALIECEDWNRDIKKKWDHGYALGLCQLNKRWHKRTEDYINKRQSQVEVCYWKWIHHTKFNGPYRKINWMYCKDYVLDRFVIVNENPN